jgi:cytochrome c556
MTRIGGRGPQALSRLLDAELKQGPPRWETIQAQTKEYADLAAALGKSGQPRKGAPESWAKLTASYAELAAALNQAAQSKDTAAAREAHGTLSKSCMECHREHRGGPGGGPPGGPRPPRGEGPPPGRP